MNKIIILLIAFIAVACQTTRINKIPYNVSGSNVNLGSIGTAVSFDGFTKDFSMRSLPVLKNAIRVDVMVVPFDTKSYSIYSKKIREAQIPDTVKYIDSLPEKPKFAIISLMDYTGLIAELNNEHNGDVTNYIKILDDAKIVTSVATVLPIEIISKIQQADTYYLVNDQLSKYSITLVKSGKKLDTIDLTSGTLVGYRLSEFCWAENDRNTYYIGDIVSESKRCSSVTTRQIERKKEASLYKM